jgi:NCS1 family nucleobase:cation symporter-1
LKPVEKERRQWRSWNFVGFWIADSFNINTWMISSSMIVGGLSWWQAWICVWIGYTVTGVFVAMNARFGAMYHIGFPVANRSSFGIWGSLWPVFNRAAMGKCQSSSPHRKCFEMLTPACSQLVFGTESRATLVATASIL